MIERLEKLIDETIKSRNERELALGFLRYEALRKLNPRQYELRKLRHEAGHHENFDELVDELL